MRKSVFDLPVEDVIMMGRANYIDIFGSPNENDIKIVDEVMTRLHINNLQGNKYSDLSGGEQQLVMIARAIVQQTQFIILDEPESNLDYKNRKKVMDVIKELAESGIGIIAISHIPEMAIYWNAKVFMIGRERRYVYGTVDEVFKEDILSEIYDVGISIAAVKGFNGNEKKVLFLN